MGQAEVQMILEKKDEWMTAQEIAEELGVENVTLVRRALIVMKKFNEVFFRAKQVYNENGRRFFTYEYKIKI